ncbi:MAG: ribonuclease III [Hyphomicrobiales bacterium]
MATRDKLAARIGYDFASDDLLQRALTHSSYRAGGKKKPSRNNERLEFLGDRVLGLVIADWLFATYPDENEGDLAPKLNALVRKETCAHAAQDINLGKHLKLGRGEESAGGRDKMAVLGNAMEALIAAVYLDGGYSAAHTMVLHVWEPHLATVTSLRKDAKTALQEWAQARGLPSPVYREKERTGPDHEPVFVMEVEIQGHKSDAAQGASKRIAEQSAAEAFLRRKKIW